MFVRRLLPFAPPVRSMATPTSPNPNLVNVNVDVNANDVGPRERLIRAKVSKSSLTISYMTK